MGRSEYKAFISRLAVSLAHLLKWQYQPKKQSNSWVLTIQEQRKMVQKLLNKHPSFKANIIASFTKAYDMAILLANKETKIDISEFPSNCPYTFEQTIDQEFYPDDN